MKNKNNGLIIISFFVFLLSCKGTADYSVSQEHANDTIYVEKRERMLLNDSFSYQFVLSSGKADNGIYYTIGFETLTDSSYTNYLKTLTSEYILELLESEESDFATDVTLEALYTPLLSDFFDLGDNKAENWRKKVVKKRVIEYWKKELSERNHDSLRLVYLESLNIQPVEGFLGFWFDSNAAKKSDDGNYLFVKSIDSREQMNVVRNSRTGKYSKYEE